MVLNRTVRGYLYGVICRKFGILDPVGEARSLQSRQTRRRRPVTAGLEEGTSKT